MEAPRLIGVYEHTLDDKGRVTLPVKFRGYFEGPVVLADIKQAHAPCVRVYTSTAWDKFVEQRVENLDDFDDAEAGMRRRRINNAAYEVEVDKQGRVLLPATMIEYFGLNRGASVLIAGNGTHLEIWDPETYKRLVAQGAEV